MFTKWRDTYSLKYPAALNGPQLLAGTYLKTPIAVSNGEAEVPSGPGLGVEVDDCCRSASPHSRPPVRCGAGPLTRVEPPGSTPRPRGRWRFRDSAPGSLELTENSKPVLVYNYGMQLADGAPERYRRSGYLHPVYAPDGWCLRSYGFLGVNYPGLKTYTLEPGKPLTLRVKVTVFSK